MKVYSPSQTKSYLESPMGWYLHYVEGWSPKYLGRKELSGYLGSAFAKGMECYHTGGGDVDSVYTAAMAELMTSLEKAFLAGYSVLPKEEVFYGNLSDHLRKLVDKGMNNSPIPSDWIIVGSEVNIPECGNCRLDLLVSTPGGETFVDYKSKVTLESGYLKDKVINEWSQDWQFYHYAWALKESQGVNVSEYHVALVIATGGTKPVLHTYPIDPELLLVWYDCARQTWTDMEECELGLRKPVWDFKLNNQYGPNPWNEAIINNHFHESLMSRNYVQRKKK